MLDLQHFFSVFTVAPISTAVLNTVTPDRLFITYRGKVGGSVILVGGGGGGVNSSRRVRNVTGVKSYDTVTAAYQVLQRNPVNKGKFLSGSSRRKNSGFLKPGTNMSSRHNNKQ